MGKPVIDLTGLRYGRLTVISRAEGNKRGHALWMCKCDCGNECVVQGQNLRRGITKSCGCYAADMRVVANTIHGDCGTRLYRIWKGVVSRCRNKSSTDYKWYGAKGVSVCEEWSKYENFRDWATNNGYKDNLTIDRIDPFGNYDPSNCRWATTQEQNFNKRNSRRNQK